MDEHPNSQQGCSGSLLATQDGRERIHGGEKGKKSPKRHRGEITRAGGKGKREKLKRSGGRSCQPAARTKEMMTSSYFS